MQYELNLNKKRTLTQKRAEDIEQLKGEIINGPDKNDIRPLSNKIEILEHSLWIVHTKIDQFICQTQSKILNIENQLNQIK